MINWPRALGNAATIKNQQTAKRSKAGIRCQSSFTSNKSAILQRARYDREPVMAHHLPGAARRGHPDQVQFLKFLKCGQMPNSFATKPHPPVRLRSNVAGQIQVFQPCDLADRNERRIGQAAFPDSLRQGKS
jgi:hypothetical protein